MFVRRNCPVFVRSYVAHKVWEHMRQPALHSCDGGSDGLDDSDEDDSDDCDDTDAPLSSSSSPQSKASLSSLCT